MSQFLWWGYIHVNGSIQVKRYFDKRDLDDAYESDFVGRIFQPFECESREDAFNRIQAILTVEKL